MDEIAGIHAATYEAFYQQVDPAGTDHVGAMDAAAFLKKSGLPDLVLGKVWELADTNGKGYLDKKGFFVALKLISLAQNGKEVSIANLKLPSPAPVMGNTRKMSMPIDYSIKLADRTKYEAMFDSLGPVGDKLPGTKVKPIMLNSKLPVELLGKIWDLSDIDQDGSLDKEEFILAMHLVTKALENVPVPSVLPPDLIPLSKRKKSLSGGAPILPNILPQIDGTIMAPNRRPSTPSVDVALKNALNKAASPWVVSAIDKTKYDEMFRNLDRDQDGFVSGLDIKDTLIQSGLPQPVLAHIWNLCDIKQIGKLNAEQFALAMYLINQRLQGNELPSILLPEMVPPTMRPKPSVDAPQENLSPVVTSETSSGSKELEMMNDEIKELQKEKSALEKEIAQKEADLKIKNAEVKSLQTEHETLSAVLKQLENQKVEAKKRLDDLDNQKSSLENSLSEIWQKIDEETQQVEKLKKDLEEQNKTLEEQESELNAKRQELNNLRNEENALEKEIENGRSQLDTLSKNLQDIQLQISQTKAKITHLEEQQRQLTDVTAEMDTALYNGDLSKVNELTSHNFSPSMTDLDYQLSNSKTTTPVNGVANAFTNDDEGFKEDPFKEDPFSGTNGFAAPNEFAATDGFTSDPFAGEDPFKGVDPFKEDGAANTGAPDPFGGDPFGGFNATFPPTNGKTKEDAFKAADPFGAFPTENGTAAVTTTSSDPFDPFGSGAFHATADTKKSGGSADPFGADPFLSTPPVAPPRPESPTPALPPKKNKAPPPRPAPPKHANSMSKPGPTRAAPVPPPPPVTHDPFSSSDFGKPSESSNTASDDPFASAFGGGTLGGTTTTAPEPFDPFGLGNDNKDPFASSQNSESFANFADFEKFGSFGAPPVSDPYAPVPTAPPSQMTEEEQLAWAAEESLRLEQDRLRTAEKEQAELELALTLSRVEAARHKK